jgi:hypothetical protein
MVIAIRIQKMKINYKKQRSNYTETQKNKRKNNNIKPVNMEYQNKQRKMRNVDLYKKRKI